MSREQVRRFDRQAIEQFGINGLVLMENAGRSCAELAAQMLGPDPQDKPVAVFCGAGNNGGDGFVIARHLHNYGSSVRVVLCAERGKIRGDALANLLILEKINIPIVEMDFLPEKILPQVRSLCSGCGLIVDALFGTGLKGEISDRYARLISCINAAGIPILAVDIPSGLDCDTGLPLPVCVQATATVTFVAAKKGFFGNPQTRDVVGRLYVASIGLASPTAVVSHQRIIPD